MEEFSKERGEFLRSFLELPNGIPESDTFRRLFENTAPEELSECLVNCLEPDNRQIKVHLSVKGNILKSAVWGA